MFWLFALFACVTDDWQEPPPPRPVIAGAPVVGAAEGFLKLPIGTPLSGFTARCSCLGNQSKQDLRESPYLTAFTPSTGVQSYPTIKVIWLENGDDHLVIAKTDSIYSFDGLVENLETQIGEATGLDLDGKVVHTTNHSHSSFGTYSDQITFYLGSDKFNRENFERMSLQITDVALTAYDTRVPAKIGASWTRDWDPDNSVYSDRRGENNELRPWGDDAPDWVGGKDPWLGLMRFDTLDDKPIAVLMNWGMHGILLGEDSPMVSTDSGGHAETVVEEAFDEPVVVMFTQGSGGDQSPRGSDDGYARMESIGHHAVGPILDAWSQTETRADEIRLETVSRSIPKHHAQIHVTRNGSVDWYYRPYEESYRADGEVYDADGKLLSPLDEFNAEYGGVFCGSGDLGLPIGQLETSAWPYSNCLNVELLSSLMWVFFELDADQDGEVGADEMPLPLPESLKAKTTATRFGPVTTRSRSGEQVSQDVFMGFFPGEATSMFTHQWQRRVESELGFPDAWMVSYSQDHEGYLLIAEDWLVGGYEPDISIWGPLEGEHVMEGVLDMSSELLSTDVHEDADPLGYYRPTSYADKPLPTYAPDRTPNAGTVLTEAPDPEGDPEVWKYLVPSEVGEVADLVIPAEVPRGQGVVQLGWIGGDPGIDSPTVTVERLEADAWIPLTSGTGRLITEGMMDILLSYTPYPYRPHEDPQTHYWWAAWQVVGHVDERLGLPLGTYRLHVEGTHYVGDNETWPWDGAPYELYSDAFDVVPGAITLEAEATGIWASVEGPANGYRLIEMGGHYRGANPLVAPIDVTIVTPSETWVIEDAEITTVEGGRSFVDVVLPGDQTSVTLVDAYGNIGTL